MFEYNMNDIREKFEQVENMDYFEKLEFSEEVRHLIKLRDENKDELMDIHIKLPSSHFPSRCISIPLSSKDNLRDKVTKIETEIFEQCKDILIRKSNDYAFGQNPFKNFINSSLVTGVSVEQGFMIRILDKVTRISNILQFGNKNRMVKDETVDDTLMDLINYSVLLLTYIQLNREDEGKNE